MKTIVLGASNKPERYAYKAQQMLRSHGHQVIPVHPVHREIEGVPVVHRLADIHEPIDTVTVYLNSETSLPLSDELIRIKPRRVIFNPGAESPKLQEQLEGAGISVENACTLVLLQTGQY